MAVVACNTGIEPLMICLCLPLTHANKRECVCVWWGVEGAGLSPPFATVKALCVYAQLYKT